MARGKWLATLDSAQHAAQPLGLSQQSASQPRSCTMNTTPRVGLEANLFEYIGVTVVFCLVVSKILMSCTPGTLLEPASSANRTLENNENVRSCDKRLLQNCPLTSMTQFLCCRQTWQGISSTASAIACYLFVETVDRI